MSKLKITLTKSAIGYDKSQGATVRGMGIRKLHQSVIQEDNAVMRGMIHKVRHLVEVEMVAEEAN